MKEVIEEGQDEKSWVTRELNRVALHTTNLENILGDPIGESASIWTAVSALTTKVSDNSIDSAGRFAAVNVEFEEMFEAGTRFQECFQKKFQKLEHRVDEFELGGDNTAPMLGVHCIVEKDAERAPFVLLYAFPNKNICRKGPAKSSSFSVNSFKGVELCSVAGAGVSTLILRELQRGLSVCMKETSVHMVKFLGTPFQKFLHFQAISFSTFFF